MTCFICEEPGGWKVCQCTDRLLHLQCQRNLMYKTASHKKGCPVCATPYNNVQSKVIRRSLTREARRLVCFFVGVVLVLGIAAYEVFTYRVTKNAIFLVIAVMFVFMSMLFIIAGCHIFRFQTMIVEQSVVTLCIPPGATHHQGQRLSASSSPVCPPCPSPSRINSPAVAHGWQWIKHAVTVLTLSPARSPRLPRVAPAAADAPAPAAFSPSRTQPTWPPASMSIGDTSGEPPSTPSSVQTDIA